MAANITVGIKSISSLTPELDEWTIRARVTNKSKIMPYKMCNDGNGDRFFFDLLDESGEIRATVFQNQLDEFYDMIEVGKVYYITQSIVKDSERAFNPLNHKYEINFDWNTQVQLCKTETNIPTQRYEFVSINEIEAIAPEELIDVIGVCRRISGMKYEQGANKIDLEIVDKSKARILVTLWEFQAENFDGNKDDVIAIKGAKVKDFRGRTLSIATSQIVEVNPNIDKAHDLRNWYEGGGRDTPTRNLTDAHLNPDYEDF